MEDRLETPGATRAMVYALRLTFAATAWWAAVHLLQSPAPMNEEASAGVLGGWHVASGLWLAAALLLPWTATVERGGALLIVAMVLAPDPSLSGVTGPLQATPLAFVLLLVAVFGLEPELRRSAPARRFVVMDAWRRWSPGFARGTPVTLPPVAAAEAATDEETVI